VVFIHPTYGTAAAAIAADAGPCHSSSVNPDNTALYDNAVDRNSAATDFHADAATSKGPEPAPEYIRAELTSGGNTPKSTTALIPPYLQPSSRRI
jgi:hypothetical protein